MEKISVIIPCYNEEESIPLFDIEIKKIADSLKKVKFEFIYIDDGSKDKTLEKLEVLARNDKRVKYISFSRNFGKESGIYAGLKSATGDYAVIIDADLQHNPNLIIEMYNIIHSGEYDSVAVRRTNRKGEPLIRSFLSRNFYKIIRKISNIEVVDGEMDFRMMSKKMYLSVLELAEYNRFSKGIFSWVGYKTKWLEQTNIERVAGETKWSFFKLLVYSMNGFTAFSTLPLSIAAFLGILFFIISFIIIIFIIVKTLVFGDSTSGWPSLVCIIFFVSGIQLFSLGIIGQYLSKIFLETKKRPIYITNKTNIEEKND